MKLMKLACMLTVVSSVASAQELKEDKVCPHKSAVKCGHCSGHAATWRDRDNPEDDYQFYLYNNQGGFVEVPGHLGSAIGVIPGVAVGAVIGVPMLPFNDYHNTVTSTTLIFGKGGSMILGLPFYGVKKIFWDFPKSMFD